MDINMDIDISVQRQLAEFEQRKRVERLLERYPEISLEEEAAVIRFLKRGAPLEVGLLKSSDAIKPQLARFRKDHADQFKIGAWGVIAVLAIIATICALVWLLWEAGMGG